jgi:hypothetical protein
MEVTLFQSVMKKWYHLGHGKLVRLKINFTNDLCKATGKCVTVKRCLSRNEWEWIKIKVGRACRIMYLIWINVIKSIHIPLNGLHLKEAFSCLKIDHRVSVIWGTISKILTEEYSWKVLRGTVQCPLICTESAAIIIFGSCGQYFSCIPVIIQLVCLLWDSLRHITVFLFQLCRRARQ